MEQIKNHIAGIDATIEGAQKYLDPKAIVINSKTQGGADLRPIAGKISELGKERERLTKELEELE